MMTETSDLTKRINLLVGAFRKILPNSHLLAQAIDLKLAWIRIIEYAHRHGHQDFAEGLHQAVLNARLLSRSRSQPLQNHSERRGPIGLKVISGHGRPCANSMRPELKLVVSR